LSLGDNLVGIVDCRVCGWPSALPFGLEGGSSPVAFDIHLEDGGMVHKPVDGSERHGRIWKDLVALQLILRMWAFTLDCCT
jgi:hypothetical protein